MTTTHRHLSTALATLAAGAITWVSLSQAFQVTDSATRSAWLAAPGLVFALLAFPALHPRWWMRVAISSAVWGLAFYGATKLYYIAGGGAQACAITGFWAAAALLGVSLWGDPMGISRNRALLIAAGVLWVLGAAAIGQGVDLNLDLPLKRPRPGRWHLLAGALSWYAPFAGLRILRRAPSTE